ncbi:hypothetical protein T265_08712 [Opisthorchis viverrini]|uniref:Uncharacterized protein n=1 Tax=Opisthorchis viverrini TaxID=6198 RepID=A0A074Z851_OPIVI|nr:hypothetical protein T265_08712 [Opisthorchis viverrini]KER23386.1 hypothetical protein T265_08712 [Opisthorchis viverrini]
MSYLKPNCTKIGNTHSFKKNLAQLTTMSVGEADIATESDKLYFPLLFNSDPERQLSLN